MNTAVASRLSALLLGAACVAGVAASTQIAASDRPHDTAIMCALHSSDVTTSPAAHRPWRTACPGPVR